MDLYDTVADKPSKKISTEQQLEAWLNEITEQFSIKWLSFQRGFIFLLKFKSMNCEVLSDTAQKISHFPKDPFG